MGNFLMREGILLRETPAADAIAKPPAEARGGLGDRGRETIPHGEVGHADGDGPGAGGFLVEGFAEGQEGFGRG